MRRVGREKQGSAWFCNGKDRQINALDLHSPDLLRQRNAKSSKGTAMYCIATAKLCLEGNGIALLCKGKEMFESPWKSNDGKA